MPLVILAEAKVQALPRSQQRNKAMAITIHIPAVLRASCAGASAFSLSAPSVRAALDEIERRYPALHRSVCDETGAVRRHVNLFVNTAHIRDREWLDTPLVSGDTITILPAVSGG
jgi:molybdopterin converting factor small subunit